MMFDILLPIDFFFAISPYLFPFHIQSRPMSKLPYTSFIIAQCIPSIIVVSCTINQTHTHTQSNSETNQIYSLLNKVKIIITYIAH